MPTIHTSTGISIEASLPSLRDAFEALRLKDDAPHAAVEQTPETLRRRIGVAKEAWQRLDAGLAQWANLLSMVRDTVRDMIVAQQPIAAAAFAALDPLLQNDIPSPDWDLASGNPTPQSFADSRRDAVEHLERRLALLTQFAVSCQMLAVQAGMGIPDELAPLLSPPFRADRAPGQAIAEPQPVALQQSAPQALPPLPQNFSAMQPALRQPSFVPEGRAAEVVGVIQQQLSGQDERSSTAATRQAQALKTLLERWTAPEEWEALSAEERNRRSALIQSLWDRAQRLGGAH